VGVGEADDVLEAASRMTGPGSSGRIGMTEGVLVVVAVVVVDGLNMTGSGPRGRMALCVPSPPASTKGGGIGDAMVAAVNKNSAEVSEKSMIN